MMKSFLLLILSMMAGCEDSSEESEVKGCPKGWVEFTWKYPKTNRNYQNIDIQCAIPKETTIQSTQTDVWENKGRVSLYDDTKNKNLRVVIKQFDKHGKYRCEFVKKQQSRSSHKKQVEVEVEKDGCQSRLFQTAYKTAKTTIPCNYTGNKNKSKFFCKENNSTCEDILSTKSSVKSNETFTLTETECGFSMSISNVSSEHAGVYWCGVELNKGNSRASRKQIQLEVKDITTFNMSSTTGQKLIYWCDYPNGAYIKKFICKGEDPSICQTLVNTAQQNKNTGKFSMKDYKEKSSISITVRDVTPDDTGTYWCGAESTDKTHSNQFFHRVEMTVKDDSSLTVKIAAIVSVAVLVLVLVLVLVYKRFKRLKNTQNEEAQDNKEDCAYEEIQECPQKPDSGTALKTIYATANFPTNPSSASQHYSNINYHINKDHRIESTPEQYLQ